MTHPFLRMLRAAAFVSLTTFALPAQEPSAPPVDPHEVAAEIAAIFARPEGTTIDAKKAVPALDALLQRYAGRDLGKMGYVRALREYLARDYAAAGASLDQFFAHHAPADVTDREHATMLGRIYLNAFAQALRGEHPDAAKVQTWLERALQLSPEPARVARAAGTLLQDADAGLAAPLRVTVVRHLLASDGADASALDGALKALYAPPARRGAAGQRNVTPPTLKPFTAKAMSGKTIDLAAHHGKVVLVDFWATWCGPCLREMPNVVAAHDKYADRGFEVIGISLDKEGAEQKIREVEQRLGMTWEQIYDGGYWKARLAVENGIDSIPRAFLIDRTGKVRYTGRDTRGEDLHRHVEELLAERAGGDRNDAGNGGGR